MNKCLVASGVCAVAFIANVWLGCILSDKWLPAIFAQGAVLVLVAALLPIVCEPPESDDE